MHAALGQCAEATTEATDGLALGRDNLTLERAARVYATCGAPAEAARLANELKTRFPQATLIMSVSVPVIGAASALGQGDAARALELLEPVKPYDRAPSAEFWPNYLRGQAYLKLKNGPEAVGQFRSIVDRQGEVPASVLYPLAHLGLARAAALMNDGDTAKKTYEQLFGLWKQTDSDLKPLTEARSEHSRLP
jgi:hypothetical protein